MINKDYLKLLSESFSNERAVFSEIINLQAILNLPKGTEHFISDIHGEYQAFNHILNSCSGVIREKVKALFSQKYSESEQSEICTLIYYPKEKLAKIKKEKKVDAGWYKHILLDLIELAKMLSSKYTRSKVRKALPSEYSYIIDELMHSQPHESENRQDYHDNIIASIIDTDSGDEFIKSLCKLIKRLAVDHLHIVGDIYDRGAHADYIIDVLMSYHSLDITWGNHDILWMGAGLGSEACIASVLRINIAAGNLEILENGYGISLRNLALFAEAFYKKDKNISPMLKAISIILFKLEGQIIDAHPEYDMNDRLFLDKIDYSNGTLNIDGMNYLLKTNDFATIDPLNPYVLNNEEQKIIDSLKHAFLNSERLKRHIEFLYRKGTVYLCYNNNLIYHGCVPLDERGQFDKLTFSDESLFGKEYLDFCDKRARDAVLYGKKSDLDFMWYLWCGKKSPMSGRTIKTFERTFIDDEKSWIEDKNPYYTFCNSEQVCIDLLNEFGLNSNAHIINGHTPIRAAKGESPIKANGRLIVIDGGFCKSYQEKTGIAGYTLIYNSHELRIKAHRPFENIDKVLSDNNDIKSTSSIFEVFKQRQLIKDCDIGRAINKRVEELRQLLNGYRTGTI